MKHKIAVLFVLALAIATPVYANYALSSYTQLGVMCPDGYSVMLRRIPGQPTSRGTVYCDAVSQAPTPAATTLPPLLSPLSTPAPVPALPTMPTQG